VAPWQSTRRSTQSRRVARKWGEVPTLSGAASGRLRTNCVTNSTFALAMDSSDMAPISLLEVAGNKTCSICHRSRARSAISRKSHGFEFGCHLSKSSFMPTEVTHLQLGS
jgi:hypothetical protein